MDPKADSQHRAAAPASPSLLARNSLILIGIEVLAKILGLVIFVSMARSVGVVDLGIYAFSMSLSNVAALLPRFGFERYVQREVPRLPKVFPHLWSAITATKVFFSGLAVGGVLLLLWVGGSSARKNLIILLILISVLLYEFIVFHAACFRAFQRPEYEAQVRLAFSGVYVVFGLITLKSNLGVFGIAIVLVGASTLGVLYSAWLLHKRIHPLTLAVKTSAIRLVLTESFPLFLLVLVVLLYNQADMLLLSLLAGDREVGIYAAAMKIYEATALIPGGVTGTVLPALARDWRTSRMGFASTFEYAARYLTVLSFPLAVGGLICAGQMVRFLYGPEYEPSAAALRVLIWAVIFNFWNHLLFAALIAMDRERILLAIGVAGVVISITMSTALIPVLGAVGSSAATVITQAGIFLLSLYPILRETGNQRELIGILRLPALCTGVMAATLWIIRQNSLPLLFSGGVIVYGISLLATGVVRPAHLKSLWDRTEA